MRKGKNIWICRYTWAVPKICVLRVEWGTVTALGWKRTCTDAKPLSLEFSAWLIHGFESFGLVSRTMLCDFRLAVVLMLFWWHLIVSLFVFDCFLIEFNWFFVYIQLVLCWHLIVSLSSCNCPSFSAVVYTKYLYKSSYYY